MCSSNNDEYCNNRFYYSNIYTNRPVVSKFNSTGIANKFNEHNCDNWYMEPGDNQYRCDGSNNLYIYTSYWSMCQYHHNEYCDNEFYYSNIYTDRAALSKFNSTGTANKFNKHTCDKWYMESCND